MTSVRNLILVIRERVHASIHVEVTTVNAKRALYTYTTVYFVTIETNVWKRQHFVSRNVSTRVARTLAAAIVDLS